MPGAFNLLRRFTGSTVSETASFAAGAAMSPTLSPLLQALRNETWSRYPDVPPDAYALADGVAQGQVEPAAAAKWAKEQGIGQAQFAALVNIANTGPGGLIPDPGLLKGELPAREGNVPAYPVYPIDALKMAAGDGYSRDELGVLVGLQGLPMGSHEAAQAEFRGVITHDDYLRAIAEGNTRNEWAAPIREQSRQIPSAVNYVEARVRNWITPAQMEAGAARHGMTSDDAELLFLIHGRPLSWHQVFIGLRRGGVYGGPVNDVDPAFLKALQESNIRPEWYNLAWAQRFSYPAAFVLRQLTKDGDLTPAETETILLYEGWEPTLAHTVATKWGETKGSAASPAVVKSQQTKLVTRTHNLYVDGEATREQAETALKAEGYPAATITSMLATWDNERALIQAVAPPPAGPAT
jgi:hypothetical protein